MADDFVPAALLGFGQFGQRLREALNPIFGCEFTDCHKCFLLRSHRTFSVLRAANSSSGRLCTLNHRLTNCSFMSSRPRPLFKVWCLQIVCIQGNGDIAEAEKSSRGRAAPGRGRSHLLGFLAAEAREARPRPLVSQKGG